ncbi:hypothetical protein LSTR_LSTR017172 [Laodelphax striatellus]|uniref:Uncharacterized protein n=1 Tax=Laodelphax striatellus TaxID=195883 RepID=A0A482XJQ1_LAOST|nr:hypothetical protein LSTR_LSTR017172 [Laodelphax striatellus]
MRTEKISQKKPMNNSSQPERTTYTSHHNVQLTPVRSDEPNTSSYEGRERMSPRRGFAHKRIRRSSSDNMFQERYPASSEGAEGPPPHTETSQDPAGNRENREQRRKQPVQGGMKEWLNGGRITTSHTRENSQQSRLHTQ